MNSPVLAYSSSHAASDKRTYLYTVDFQHDLFGPKTYAKASTQHANMNGVPSSSQCVPQRWIHNLIKKTEQQIAKHFLIEMSRRK